MKPTIPYAGAPRLPVQRLRLVPIIRKPQGDLVLSTVSEPKRSWARLDAETLVSEMQQVAMPPRPASADEVKRAVRDGWRDGLLLREIAERTGISLKRIHWAAMRLMRP